MADELGRRESELNVILCYLGKGCSMACIERGRSPPPPRPCLTARPAPAGACRARQPPAPRVQMRTPRARGG